MKTISIPSLVTDYRKWLDNLLTCSELENGWHEIQTPALDRHNDCIVVYARLCDDGIDITDVGYTLGDLELCGYDLKESHIASIRKITNSYDVVINNKELTIKASQADFSIKLHSLLHAMKAVSELSYSVSPSANELFSTEVGGWFNANNIRYSKNIEIVGHSGGSKRFNFLINGSTSTPERLVDTLHSPTQESIDAAIFKSLDTRDLRETQTKYLVILRNAKNNKLDGYIRDLRCYDVMPILWADIDNYRNEFAA